jgi:protein-tyrosine phosphatase
MHNRPTFVAVGAGRLGLWHRPPRRVIPHLPAAGCTHVVTLLSAREGAEEIGALVRAAGMGWTWIPLASGRQPEGKQDDPIRAALPELSRALDDGETVLLHCSAGMHRTGMVAYALLRWRGVDGPEALDLVATMRSATRAALAPEHLAWAESLVATR